MKPMSLHNFKKTDQYKNWRDSFREVYKEDIKDNPIEYDGVVYTSAKRLQVRIERDFIRIKVLAMKNMWQIDSDVHTCIIGWLLKDSKIESVWLKIDDKIQIVIWVDGKADLRKIVDDKLIVDHIKQEYFKSA